MGRLPRHSLRRTQHLGSNRGDAAHPLPTVHRCTVSDPRDALGALLELMQRLRDPAHGCPWDRAQTFASIVPYTIEEAYEVADAIARGAREELRDELGDLLFQVVFHARLAE